MTDSTKHTNETPEHWGAYAELLRRQPAPTMPAEHSARVLANVQAAAPAYARRQRLVRFVTAPAVTLAAAALVVLFSTIPPARETPAPAGLSVRPAKVAQAPQRAARRPARKPLDPPIVGNAEVPTADTAQLPPRIQVAPVHSADAASTAAAEPGPGLAIARLQAGENAPLP